MSNENFHYGNCHPDLVLLENLSPKPILGWKGMLLKNHVQGFPGGLVVKNPPCYARDTGSNTRPGRSHMLWSSWAQGPQLLSPHVATTKSRAPRAYLLQWEATPRKNSHTVMNSPHMLCMQQWTLTTDK